MLEEQTQFIVLPNEVIYYIFDFLSTLDIFRSFAKINHRYDDLVRCYNKSIDLTDGWQGDREEFQWICPTVEILKIDRLHIHVLTDYQLFYLNSLKLINVFNWDKIVSTMNLKNLSIWFDDNIYYDNEEGKIPETVTKFWTNIVLEENSFHANLININICVYSIVHLVEIIGHTPHIEHLSVTFADHFYSYYCVKDYQYDYFKTMIINVPCLNKLTCLSFNTKYIQDIESNEHLPFNEIQSFIDQCCSNKIILKKVALKFDHIKFCKDMWLTIVHYKNIFHRFNFYASFITDEKLLKNIKMISNNDDFDFFLEGNDQFYSQGRFIHIYSLPFAFDKLYGYTSCSDLNSQISFTTIRHLYLTRTHFTRPISFESLTKRMPNLISIDCTVTFAHGCHTFIPDMIFDRDIFHNVRFLRFISHRWDRHCVCHNLFSWLIIRMPHLQCLTTTIDTLLHEQDRLSYYEPLNIRYTDFESPSILAKHVPHLSTISLDKMIPHREELSRLVNSLFNGFPSLNLISFQIVDSFSSNPIPYDKIAHDTLILIQNMNNHLHHLRVDFQDGIISFYLLNV